MAHKKVPLEAIITDIRVETPYQPFLAFDGNSQALINVELRDGSAPSANDIVAFFRKTL